MTTLLIGADWFVTRVKVEPHFVKHQSHEVALRRSRPVSIMHERTAAPRERVLRAA